MREVYRAANAAEAHWVRAVLAERGIRAVVHGEGLPAVMGEVPFFSTLPTVHVDDGDVEATRAAIDVIKSEPDPAAEGEPWPCPQCGEMIDPQFSACWRCSGAGTIESDHITDDLSCVECDYNLRSLRADGRCPECGCPIEKSLQRAYGPPPRHIIFYTRAGCSLCERLYDRIRPHAEVLHVHLEVRDITLRRDWLDAYGERIPVLTNEAGDVLLEGNASAAEVEALLADLADLGEL